MKVAVLLASYNGEQYIREQIDSLLAQTYQDFILLIRDDQSADSTYSIEKEYEKKKAGQIKVFRRDEGTAGSKYNFWELCRLALQTDAAYFMFCDQDDVWNRDKIECTLNRMTRTECEKGNVPILVHTDLRVTDRELNILSDSFISYRALKPQCTSINRLLVQNNVTGCTMMANRALMEKAVRISDTYVDRIALHDWWFAVTASLFGEISFIDAPTVRYRQHGDNVVGATKVNTISFLISRLMGKNHVRETLQLSERQAGVIVECFGPELDLKKREYIKIFSELMSRKKAVRIYYLLKYKILKQGIVQILGELMFI